MAIYTRMCVCVCVYAQHIALCIVESTVLRNENGKTITTKNTNEYDMPLFLLRLIFLLFSASFSSTCSSFSILLVSFHTCTILLIRENGREKRKERMKERENVSSARRRREQGEWLCDYTNACVLFFSSC